MPTQHQRVNLTIAPKLYEDFQQLKDILDAPSLSALILDLAAQALEWQEDLILAKMADEREHEDTISGDSFWSIK